MVEQSPQMRPWDEEPKFRDLGAAANVLYNAGLSGRPGRSVQHLLAPYIEEGAESVLKTNLLRGLEEERRVAGRAAVLHGGTQTCSTVHGYYFADSIHATGQPIPTNFMTRPQISAAVAFVAGRRLEHRDVTPAEILAGITGVQGALVIECQRAGRPGESTLLERIADNAHASHVVLSATVLPLPALDLESITAELVVGGQRERSRVQPEAVRHLTLALRRSIAAVGPVEPGEIMVAPRFSALLDFPLGAEAAAVFDQFGRITASHVAGEFEEGFLPMANVRDAPQP